MTKLPIFSGADLIKTLRKIGYYKVRQKGRHIRLSCSDKRSITVPTYKTISKGLLRKILRDAEISLEEFLKLQK